MYALPAAQSLCYICKISDHGFLSQDEYSRQQNALEGYEVNSKEIRKEVGSKNQAAHAGDDHETAVWVHRHAELPQNHESHG